MRAPAIKQRPQPVRELLLVGSLFLAYRLGRLLIEGDVDAAFAGAVQLWSLERSLGLPSEAALQLLALDHDWLVRFANVYYAWVHFPVTGAVLLWAYLRRPDIYGWARTRLVVLTAAAFVVHTLIPLAPPRLLSMTGMVDTGHVFGPSVYGPSTDSLANQYAAMPSLHVGWAAAVAAILIMASQHRFRWLWLLYPALTLAVVVVTANHYWLDAAVALALLGVDLLVLAPAVRPGCAVRDRLAAARS